MSAQTEEPVPFEQSSAMRNNEISAFPGRVPAFSSVTRTVVLSLPKLANDPKVVGLVYIAAFAPDGVSLFPR
jgi:hypothetical protein